MTRLHLIHVARIQVVSACIPCRRLHVVGLSCISDKIVVTATCVHLYSDTSCLKPRLHQIHVAGQVLSSVLLADTSG